MLISLLLPVLAYALGSIPVGVIVGYLFIGRDIRVGGSGHSGGTNTIRQAGWLAGVLVISGDVAKGALAVWLGLTFGDGGWTPALCAGAVVAGHCWPVFAGFRGGMGLATGGGALLMAHPLGFLAGVGVLIAAAFVLKHSARASLAACVVGAPLLSWASPSSAVAGVVLAVGLVIAVRSFSDWGRKQRAVWISEHRPPGDEAPGA